MRVVTGAAQPVVRIVRGQREIDEPLTHCMAAEALLMLRLQCELYGVGRFACDLCIEVMTRRTVDREVTHLTQHDALCFVTSCLTARLVRRGELVDRRGVALHALQSAQRWVLRFEVHTMSRRRRHVAPLVRVPVHVTLDADRVRYFGVRLETVGVFEDLRERHGAARHERRSVTGLAAQITVRTAREPLVRIHHQVARQAEVVVVLHVVVRAIQRDNRPDHDGGQGGGNHDEKHGRDTPGASPQTLQYSGLRIVQCEPAPLRPMVGGDAATLVDAAAEPSVQVTLGLWAVAAVKLIAAWVPLLVLGPIASVRYLDAQEQ